MTNEERFELSEDYVKPKEESKELTPKMEKGVRGIPGWTESGDGKLVKETVDEQISELWPDG